MSPQRGLARATSSIKPHENFSNADERDAWLQSRIAASDKLKPGEPLTDPLTIELRHELWAETLDEVGSSRFDAALKHVLKTSKFRPDIAEIREAAGLGGESPINEEADAALIWVVTVIDGHGINLKPRRGGIKAERDSDGRLLQVPDRYPDVPAPAFPAVHHRAVELMGAGDFTRGLTKCVPPVDGSYGAGRERQELKKQWRSMYAIAKDEVEEGLVCRQ